MTPSYNLGLWRGQMRKPRAVPLAATIDPADYAEGYAEGMRTPRPRTTSRPEQTNRPAQPNRRGAPRPGDRAGPRR